MPAPLLAPDFDAATAYPEVASMRAALTAHDWPAVRAAFDGLDPTARVLLTWEAGELRDIDEFLRATVAADPEDTLAATLLAANYIEIGWEIRTADRAKDVSAEQFAALHDYLRRAELLLIDVTAREPDHAAAWNLRLTTARGLQLGQAEARRRYDRLARHHPHEPHAQQSLLQQLCPKWGGSFEQVHTFARERSEAAPPGALNAVLVVKGHLENASDDGLKYLKRPEVRQEIDWAAQRSVLHPNFQPAAGWVGVRSTFAFYYYLIGDHAAAATEFDALGHLASKDVWSGFDDPAREFSRARAESLEKGRKR